MSENILHFEENSRLVPSASGQLDTMGAAAEKRDGYALLTVPRQERRPLPWLLLRELRHRAVNVFSWAAVPPPLRRMRQG